MTPPADVSPATPEFSHKPNFTHYMRVVEAMTGKLPAGRVLDIPAGAGQLTEAMRRQGHTVVPADINGHDESFVYADMTRRLPFDDQAFDLVVCLEGVEHMFDPHGLIGELFRVCRIGGQVIITTPNVTNMYSRLQFLFTGTLHQFHFTQLRDLPPDAEDDRFHVSPICLGRLSHEGRYWGAQVIEVSGDRFKRKALLPLFGLIHLAGWWWTRRLYLARGRPEHDARNRAMLREARSLRATLGRSIIVRYEKHSHVVEQEEFGSDPTRGQWFASRDTQQSRLADPSATDPFCTPQ